jgi:imidazolonepropionase-like amidohydrolase
MKTILFIIILISISFSQQTIIHAGKMIDVEDEKVRNEVSIIIEDGKIIDIKNGFINGTSDDLIIDLKNKTVLPGLMDMHTHLSGEFSANSYSEGFRMNPEDYAFRSTVFAKRTLMAGFTTVREVGGIVSISLRNAINRGYVVGPRIYSAGMSLATTGGHADPTNGVNRKLMGDPGAAQGVVNGVESARKAVRQRYKDGADHIKITATGGVLSVAKNGQNPQFSMEELKAIIETANDYEMHVAAHAHGAEGMKRAIIAGVRSIEHGTLMTSEVMKLMKKHGTFYVPTAMAGDWVAEKSKIDGFFPALVRPKAAEIGPKILATLAKAHKAGVKIAFGTDSGVSAHGDNAREFELMVDAGMTTMEAIKAATMTTAELLKITDILGSIKKGKIADIIAVDGNPIDNISLLKDVKFVMKDGVVVKNVE